MTAIELEFKRRDWIDRTYGDETFRNQVHEECRRAKVIPIASLTDEPEVIRQRAYIATRQSWERYR